MTSANVTYYTVKDAQGKTVFVDSQHALCHNNALMGKLKALPNPETMVISARWPDEQECDHYSRDMPLDKFLNGDPMVFPSTMGEDLYDENQLLKAENERLKRELGKLEMVEASFANIKDIVTKWQKKASTLQELAQKVRVATPSPLVSASVSRCEHNATKYEYEALGVTSCLNQLTLLMSGLEKVTPTTHF